MSRFTVGLPGDDDADDSFDADSFGAYQPRKRPGLLVRRDRMLLPLEWKDEQWSASPSSPFRPRGLIVLGQGPTRGFIAAWSVGPDLVMPYGTGPLVSLDAMTFMESLPHDAPCRPSFPTMDQTMTVRLKVVDAGGYPLGPPLELTVWGEGAIYL